MLFGGMMVTRGEALRLLRAHRSLDAFLARRATRVALRTRPAALRTRHAAGPRQCASQRASSATCATAAWR